jgi:hypothetical protein
MSKEEAWKVMAVEILAGAGLVAPEPSDTFQVPRRVEYVTVPIDEAKLIRVVRIEPAEDDRVQRLLAQARSKADVSREDPPSMSSVVRQALRLGLDELERERYRK